VRGGWNGSAGVRSRLNESVQVGGRETERERERERERETVERAGRFGGCVYMSKNEREREFKKRDIEVEQMGACEWKVD
jgi:hypothetical protein